MSIIYWVSECLFKHSTELKKEKLLCMVLLFLYEIQLLNFYFPLLYSLSPSHSSLQLSGVMIAPQPLVLKTHQKSPVGIFQARMVSQHHSSH